MTNEGAKRIELKIETGPVQVLKKDLEEAIGLDSGVELRLESGTTSSDRMPVDPTVLVAAIAAVGAGLPVLISGLFGLLTNSEKIVLKGKNGRSVEIPADTPTDELRELVGLAIELDVEEITIAKSKEQARKRS